MASSLSRRKVSVARKTRCNSSCGGKAISSKTESQSPLVGPCIQKKIWTRRLYPNPWNMWNFPNSKLCSERSGLARGHGFHMIHRISELCQPTCKDIPTLLAPWRYRCNSQGFILSSVSNKYSISDMNGGERSTYCLFVYFLLVVGSSSIVWARERRTGSQLALQEITV